MKPKSPAIPVDVMFRAVSDRTRLRILHLLRGGEVCVCNVVDVLGLPQPTVSRHLAYLRRARLVSARKEGLWVHYSLAPARNRCHAKLLECVWECFGDGAAPTAPQQARQRSACCAP